MVPKKALRFSAAVHKLGINPCVDVPQPVVRELQRTTGREAGPIRVKGRLNGKRFTTTVVRYAGDWRLYLNTAMRADAKVEVGDEVTVEVALNRTPRVVPTPSHRKDILNYLNSLKTAESLDRNIKKAIAESLAGRGARRS